MGEPLALAVAPPGAGEQSDLFGRTARIRSSRDRDPGVLTVRLFGGMVLRDPDGRDLLPRSRKTRGLIVLLALPAPKPMSRQQITDLLWSRRAKEQGRASLRQSVHELHEVLGPVWSHVLIAERHQLAMDHRLLAVDARLASDASAPRIALLERLQEGFLEDLAGLDPAFDEFLGAERRRLLTLARVAGESLLHAPGRPAEMIPAARLLLHIDPTHDNAWRALIQAHIDTGDRSTALLACRQWSEAMMLPPTRAPPPELAAFLARLHAGAGMWFEEAPAGVREDGAPFDPRAPGHQPGSTAPAAWGIGPARRSVLRLGIREMRQIGAETDSSLPIGLTEELTTALSRFRWLSCIPPNPEAAIAGGTPRRSELDLCLDGTIQGTVRGVGPGTAQGGTTQGTAGGMGPGTAQGNARGTVSSGVRITARLLDMRAGGEVIWANRFDRDAGDVLALQEGVAAAIVAQLEPLLLIREGERATRDQHAASPRDLVLKAVPAIYRLDRQSFRAAGALLETALRLDPGHTDALAWLAYWHLFLVGQGWAEEPDAATERAGQLADAAVTTDPGDARALTLAGHVRGFLMKRAAEALVLHDRAIALNPNLAIAWCFSGCALSYLGDHDRAIVRLRQALELSPSDPHLFFFKTAIMISHVLRAEYTEAATAGREAIELNPGFSSGFKMYLAALGHLGRTDEATLVRTRLLKLEPGFSVREAIRRSPMIRTDDLERYASGLRTAGLPED